MKLNGNRASNIRFKLTDESTRKNYGCKQKFLGACLLTSGDTLHFENIQELEDTIGVLDSMRRLSYMDRKELENKANNHEEDIDMMKEQSMDFNIGYAFNSIERAYAKQIKDGIENYIGTVSIPKIWFGLKPLGCEMISSFTVNEMWNTLNSLFDDITPSGKYEIRVTAIKSNRQYIDIDYKIKKKEPIKKMTVEEIEKALGYKVEIVSE